MTDNNPNIYIVNFNAQTEFGQIISISSLDIKRTEYLTPIKGHNSVSTERKMICNHPKLDHVNINAFTKIKLFSRY